MNSRRTRFRGGTVIVADVHDIVEHEKRLRNADGYRPAICARCGGSRIHVHDRLQRVLTGERPAVRIAIIRYICAAEKCGATWRVLPAFVARHLWRRWSTVARTIATRSPDLMANAVPARTRRRWKARLSSAARQLVHMLAQHDEETVARFASVVGFSTRRELIELFVAGRVLGVHGLADIAGAVHALERGIRLV